MEDLMEKQNDTYSKPGYDGRLGYYKVLTDYMAAIAKVSIIANFGAWIRMLRGMFALVKPYMKPSDVERIKNDLKEVQEHFAYLSDVKGKDTYVKNQFLDTKLQDITEDIYTSSKHMLLPLSEEEDHDFFDYDTFQKMS